MLYFGQYGDRGLTQFPYIQCIERTNVETLPYDQLLVYFINNSDM